MPKITQQVSGRTRTTPRHLPRSSGLFLCNTLSNLSPPPFHLNTYSHQNPLSHPDVSPRTQARLSPSLPLLTQQQAIPSPPFNTQGPPPLSWLSSRTHPHPRPFPKSPICIRTQHLGLRSLTAVRALFYLTRQDVHTSELADVSASSFSSSSFSSFYTPSSTHNCSGQQSIEKRG